MSFHMLSPEEFEKKLDAMDPTILKEEYTKFFIKLNELDFNDLMQETYSQQKFSKPSNLLDKNDQFIVSSGLNPTSNFELFLDFENDFKSYHRPANNFNKVSLNLNPKDAA